MSTACGEGRDDAAARPNAIDVYVGQQIRQRRNSLGLSQEQLAAELGVSFQQVQKYERGFNRVGASRLYDLTRALGVPIGYFFDEVPSGRPRPPGGLRGLGDHQEELDNDVMKRRETLDLVCAFTRITDAQVRRHVLDLIRSLGADTSG